MPKRSIILLFLLSYVCAFPQQLKLDTSFTKEQLVDKFVSGNGVRIGNVKLTGQKHSVGFFSVDTNVLGMKSGLLLSTGNVFDIAGPNISSGITGTSWNRSSDGRFRADKDLSALAGDAPYDQVMLEFDFVPYENHVTFNFIFASEEYPEYVGSEFNDVFGFFLSGSNIRKENLALIPGTEDPVSINNINHKKNKELFINNNYFHTYGLDKNGEKGSGVKRLMASLFNRKTTTKGTYYSLKEKKKLNQYLVSNIEFDGMTKLMQASCYLTPWKLYHLKIAVGDVSDAIYDSGVFLEQGSFGSEKDTAVPGYKPYANLYDQMNWDSLFKKRKKYNYQYQLPPIDERFRITRINFDSDQFLIPDTSMRKLDSLAVYLKNNPITHLSITGYTDTTGAASHNQLLSENRAAAITAYLERKGIDKRRLVYAGNSFFNPVADNSSDFGRLLNRRVELTIFNKVSK